VVDIADVPTPQPLPLLPKPQRPVAFFFKDSFIRFFSPRSLPYIPYVVHTCVKRKEVKFLKNAKKKQKKVSVSQFVFVVLLFSPDARPS